jgi:L-ascorbate metabolism protein UlaG (beta-lactamase superfamily)
MKRIIRILTLAGGMVLLHCAAFTQEPSKPAFVSSPRRVMTAPELKDAPDEWIERSLQWVDYILENYPPALVEHPVRRAALIRLDDVLHIESAPLKEPVQMFYRERMERAVTDIEQTKVTEGMRVWKLYNHGFLIRTPLVSIAFDIVPGMPSKTVTGFSISPDVLKRLVAQADVMFISHMHYDHANQDVARIFLDSQKPVVAPEGLWANIPDLSTRLTYPKRSTEIVHSIAVRDGSVTLKVVAYPGHQGKAPIVNVNLVATPDGFTVVHTGDQSGFEGPGGDFDWIAQIGRDHHVDLLLPNCWGNELGRTIRGVNPELVITGHENEMSHTVDHREDYTQTYNHLFESHYPAIVMGWGESYLYRKDRVRQEALTGVVHN